MEVNATIFLQIFIFMTLLVWLSRSLFAPIMRVFDERERRIDGAKIEALSLNSLADEKAKTFATEYEKARDGARQVLAYMKNEMEEAESKALAKIKVMVREKLERAEKDLLVQEGQIRQQLMGASATIADDMVNALLRRSA